MGSRTEHPNLGKNKHFKESKKFTLNLFKEEGGFRNKVKSSEERDKIYIKVNKQFFILRGLVRETDNSKALTENQINEIMEKQIKYDLGEHRHTTLKIRIKALSLMSTSQQQLFAH